MSLYTNTGKNHSGTPYNMYDTDFGVEGVVEKSSAEIILQYADYGQFPVPLTEYREHLVELLKWVDERIEEIGK